VYIDFISYIFSLWIHCGSYMSRTSLRRKSTTSLLFESRTKPNQAQTSRRAKKVEDARKESLEQVRQKELQKSRDAALMKLYDEAALRSIDAKKFLGMDAATQRLKLLQELRSIKFIATKTRREQLNAKQEKAEENTDEVWDMMKRNLTKFVADVFFGCHPDVDVRDTMLSFPMELYAIMRDIMYSDYLKRENPISKKWAANCKKAEEELKLILKKIKMKVYKTYDSFVSGEKKIKPCLEIAKEVASELRKESIRETLETFNDLTAFTKFESRLIQKLGADISLINIATMYGNTDCSAAITCLGDILENYLIFSKKGSWKHICGRMVRKVKIFFEAQSRIENEGKNDLLPCTQYEYDANMFDDKNSDKAFVRNVRSREIPAKAAESIEKHIPILIEASDDEEIQPPSHQFYNRRYASELQIDQTKNDFSLQNTLKRYGLERYIIDGNGDCAFAAFKHQLESKKNPYLLPDVASFRALVVTNMQQIRADSENTSALSEFLSMYTDEEVLEILINGRWTSAAMDALPLLIARAFQVRIFVIKTTGEMFKVEDEIVGSPEGPIYVIFNGSHYDSVVKIQSAKRGLDAAEKPHAKRQKTEDLFSQFSVDLSDSTPPCSPEPSTLPELECLTQEK